MIYPFNRQRTLIENLKEQLNEAILEHRKLESRVKELEWQLRFRKPPLIVKVRQTPAHEYVYLEPPTLPLKNVVEAICQHLEIEFVEHTESPAHLEMKFKQTRKKKS